MHRSRPTAHIWIIPLGLLALSACGNAGTAPIGAAAVQCNVTDALVAGVVDFSNTGNHSTQDAECMVAELCAGDGCLPFPDDGERQSARQLSADIWQGRTYMNTGEAPSPDRQTDWRFATTKDAALG